MKKENTVKAHREFDRIIHRGRRISSPHYSVYYLPRSLEVSRVGLSVGKKNGIAVKRVLIKRQVRCMVAKAGLIDKPFDVIIAIRADYDPGKYLEMEGELMSLLQRIEECPIE